MTGAACMKNRTAKIKRTTKETDIAIGLNIDGKGKARVNTGIGFLNHMLELFAYHGLFDLDVKAEGDLDVDTHHTNEDIGIVLGQAFKKALHSKRGIKRFGQSFVPMDEALSRARVVLDISGRPSVFFNNNITGLKTANAYDINDCEEFLKAFTQNSGINMHVDIIRGKNTHHILESVFKALGRALAEAVRIEPRRGGRVPSTKGRL
jgi:imidazoleglycerol-phosphate dehydratase